MNNKQIATKFNLLGKLMELYGENPFKIRSYANAYLTIRKLEHSVLEMSQEELSAIKGVGKAISEKILTIKETGSFPTLDRFVEKTPQGIIEMIQIKGLGPKKVKQLWEELNIQSPGELLYACNENRLVDLKGFGEKTQKNIEEAISYFLDSQGSYLYGHIEKDLFQLLELLQSINEKSSWSFVGDVARIMPVIEKVEILTDSQELSAIKEHPEFEYEEGVYSYNLLKFEIIQLPTEELALASIQKSASDEFLDSIAYLENGENETDIFDEAGYAFIPPELRESPEILEYDERLLDGIIKLEDIKGLVHNHTTYSDGLHSLEQMALAAKEKSYEYIVITDHSKSAFYANGLQEERLFTQLAEIKKLNASFTDFKIISGIESDILNDGSLDYPDDVLAELDVVIASVHSNLKMSIEKATSRIIKAVEHPATKILGHPTGRLLLSRKAYPIDHEKIIDACAANAVVIEINANPYRLDLDWQWIPYAMEKNVMISINPDAHSIDGIDDTRFGVLAARKGRLTREMTLNAKSLAEFEEWINS